MTLSPTIADAYEAAKRRQRFGLDPEPRPPDPPWMLARDLIDYRRRTIGSRAVLVVGRFPALDWPAVHAIVSQVSDDDVVIAAILVAPGDDPTEVADRVKLLGWLRCVDFPLPWQGPAAELAERIGADLVVTIDPVAAEATR